MPMLEIPYARSAPYDNSEYVARMADLMLRRGDVEADALRRAGDRRAQMWTNAGNVTMSTIAQIGAARDAERQRALALQQQAFDNAMKQRDYELRVREADEAAKARMQAQQFQQAQFKDARARSTAEMMAPGTMVAPEDFNRFAGTSMEPMFEHRDAVAGRLPARGTSDGLPIASLRAPVGTQAAVGASQDGTGPTGETITNRPVGTSISPNVAAIPEHYRKLPTFAETKQAEELDLRRRSNEIAALNTAEDNRRADAAAAATQRYRDAMLKMRERELNASQASNEPLTEGGLDLAATTLRVTGKMPAMGMGKDPDRKRIMNRAAEQAAALEQTPAAVLQAQAVYRADGEALKSMTKARAAAHAFESKALEQSRLVAQLSKQVSRTDYPIINGLLVQGQILAGKSNAQLLNNALLTFTSEYAKIMAGGTGSAAPSTDAAQAHARELISAALADGTLQQTVKQMEREMRWTMDGYNSSIAHITDSLSGRTTDWGDRTPQDGKTKPFFDENQ